MINILSAHPHTTPTARNEHRCEWCLYPIQAGERYVQQASFRDGGAFRARYHAECWDALSEKHEFGFEYKPGEGDPPARILELTKGAT